MDTSVTPASTRINVENIKKLPIMISLIIGAFFSILNETLLNIALPTLVIDLNVSESTIQWLAAGYMLLVGVLVPASALLVQWFTTRQMFLGALILFTLGTIVCAVSPTFSVLLAGRLLQAAGTGLMLPVLMNTILVLYPPEKRGAAMGTLGLVIMFAPAIGPTLSGLILDSLSWRWLFILVIPFAVFSIIFAFIYLKNVTDVSKPKVDIFSIILSTLGFGGIVYGFSSAGEVNNSWSSPEVYISLTVGVVALIWFVLLQIKSKEPMLDLRPFKFPMFTLTTILLIIVMMTMFSTMLLLPFLLQGALLFTAFMTGLIMLPGGVLNGLLSPLLGKLFDKYGPRVLVIPGTILLIVIMWLFTTVDLETTKTTFIFLHISIMIAIAMIMMPVQTNGLNVLPRKLYPHGTAILNTLMQVSGAIGVAFFISIMSSGQRAFLEKSPDPTSFDQIASALMSGVEKSFKVGLVFAFVALVVAFFIKRTKAPVEQE
jgi:DHA2 family lincomycin resistance protein-like MFS transporter